MSTPRQIAANRANSQKSTGPKTSEGKAKSCLNRVSHGLTSSALLIPREELEEFNSLLLDLMTEFQPATPTEQILVEKMTLNQWLSLRAFRLQGEAFILGDHFAVPANLGVLIRYHTTAERAFHTAHNELVKVQRERKKSEIGFESQEPAAKPETISINTVDPPETASSGTPGLESDRMGLPETPDSGPAALKNVA